MKTSIAATLVLIVAWGTGYADELPAKKSATVAQGAVSGTTEEKPAESRWQLGFALGYGLRTNPLVQSDDFPILLDIDVAWFGDRFFFDNGDLGLTFAANRLVTASLIARVNSDRVFFGRTNTRFVTVDGAGAPLSEAVIFEVPDRSYATELGLEVLADGNWGQLQVTAFHDISGTHDGYEAYIDYGFGWRSQRWYIEPSFGLSYKSDALNNYYWGVRDDESSVALQPYVAGDGINAHARLALSYQINQHWSFSLVSEIERINDEAAASPLVEDSNVVGYFAGFGFRF